MDPTKLTAFVNTLFASLEALPVLRRFAKIKAFLEQARIGIDDNITNIAAKIPANASTTTIIDTIFAYLETTFPQWAVELQWLQVIVDALFANVPVIP